MLQCAAEEAERTVSGGHGGGETPVPIPNTAVKPARADGTWGEAPWESRSPPGFLMMKAPRVRSGGFVVLGACCEAALVLLVGLGGGFVLDA